MKHILADDVCQALADAGVIEEVDRVRRVVIDLQAGHVPVLHVERYGDERLLAVVRKLDGIEVERR